MKRAMLVMMMAGMVALAWTPMATAHGGNHGTIKVHDNADADPDVRNEPHVDCDFWIEAFNMHDSSGELVIYGWPPTGDKSEVLRADWTGDLEADEDGHHFLEGPFSLPSGHYRVEAFSTDGHPGGHDHFSKAKMFWVECEPEQPSQECPPTSLMAKANEDGSILVSWDTSGEVNLYRAEGSGDLEYVGTFDEDETYFDTDTTVGTTYTYAVTVFNGETESEICAMTEVTAIPVFPSVVAALAAVALSGLGYAAMRRR